ncbi:type IV secretion system DNA-binding domain-containing protein [Gemmiger formicilis]|nr:type IV secretion system DNA-binding domain-containing protein [Gemmiger formicilis]
MSRKPSVQSLISAGQGSNKNYIFEEYTMKQAVLLIDCYLYGTIAILAVVLLVLVYLHGQANHLPNPFARKNIVYRPAPKARGVLLGKKYGLLAYSPEPDEGHIIVMGPSGTGKTSALLIPTLRSWQGTALVVDISGDISANVGMPNKIIFDPTAKDCVPYDVFASIDAAPDESERQERLEQLAYLLLPDKANDSEAGIFFAKNGRKMITAALICYYGMGWGFVEICEYFLGHDWRSLLNDIAQQKNKIANMYISSFVGASEQNTAGCKQAADDALKLFATNDKIKNALRKTASYEPSISPATLETNSIYIYIPDEKLKIYGDLLRIITAQSMEYFSSRPKEHTQMILFCLDEFASFGKLQITEALRKLRKRHIRIMVLTQSLADLDMIYGKDERKAMLGNFKFTVLLGCKDTETQEYFSKMIGDKRSPLETDSNAKPQPIIKPADLAHLEQDLFVICDDGAIRLRKNFYFK